VVDGGVVLAWCPTYKLMEKSQHFRRSVVILVEWIPAEFATWARLCGAFNVVTGEVLDPALGHEEARALEGIAAAGYKGWHDVTSQQMTLRYLDDFSKVSHYDRELVLAYARRTKSERSIATLAKILDEFEASVRTDWAKPDDEVPPASRDW
jgi:hypothetical protein